MRLSGPRIERVRYNDHHHIVRYTRMHNNNNDIIKMLRNRWNHRNLSLLVVLLLNSIHFKLLLFSEINQQIQRKKESKLQIIMIILFSMIRLSLELPLNKKEKTIFVFLKNTIISL